MPDGTVPSSTEALRAALNAARGSLERQLGVSHSEAAQDALRQVQSALRLLPPDHMPADRLTTVTEADWTESPVLPAAVWVAETAQPLRGPSPVPPDVVDAPADQRDNLTRIRAIDDVLARRLNAIGIQRFAQIAAWQADDVRTIADAMGLGRRFIAAGVVEQAIALDRERLSARKDAARRVAPSSPLALTSIAVWEPTTQIAADPRPATLERVVETAGPWRPLAADDLRHAVATLHAGLPMNRIVPLSLLLPSLAQAIHIPFDKSATIEVPRWQTGVLVPLVEPRAAPDIATLSAPPAQPGPVQYHRGFQAGSTHTKASPAAQRGPDPVDSPSIPHQQAARDPTPAAPPLHEVATVRIRAIEAEIDTLAATSPLQSPFDDAQPSPRDVRRVAEPPLAAPRGAAHEPAVPGDIEEAEVRIVVGSHVRASQPMLAPLPELPLTSRPTSPARLQRRPLPPSGSASVEEAAVVIIRRPTAQSAAADLPFYAAPADVQAPSPVSRFVRALTGT